MFSGFTSAQVAAMAQSRLRDLRQALRAAQDLQAWLSGLSVADLTGIGFTTEDAQDIKSAVADAAALTSLYDTGLPPASYPQPPSAYHYGASQTLVIGPQ